MTGFTVITVIMEVVMWIKTCDGRYINSDWVSEIYTTGGDTYAHIGESSIKIFISRTEDIRATIVQKIISDEKFMEVQ